MLLLIIAIVCISCKKEVEKTENQKLTEETFDKISYNVDKENDKWNMDSLRRILKVESDSKVMFEELYDFNNDGVDELIIAFGYENNEEQDYIDDIYYIGLIDGKYEVYDHLEHSGYHYFDVDFIHLENKENPVLYCRITNYADLEGFELYDVQSNSLHQMVYSASHTGVGYDEMLDVDEDGIYQGYLQKRESYDSLYTVLYRRYSYIDGSFVLEDISADFYNYPSTAEETVRQFLNLHTLLNNEEMDIPDVDSRINELCPKNFKPAHVCSMEEMMNYNMSLDTPFVLRTESFEQNNITYVYQEHESDDKFPTVVYSLGENDGKWQIYDYRVIGGDKSLLSSKIDSYFEKLQYDKSELLDKYRSVLMSEVPLSFEYVVANGIEEFMLENISYDGYWLKPMRFSLLDMDQDSIPELIVQGELGAAGFTLIIREVDGKMIAHEFSHRQMYDLKSDGSFGATGGAAYSGYFYLMFDKLEYTINRIAETDTEKDEEGNLKSIFYVGETLTDEDEFWDFWNTLMRKEPALWEYFGMNGVRDILNNVTYIGKISFNRL